MTPQQINQAIAEHIGWKIARKDSNGTITSWRDPQNQSDWPTLYAPLDFATNLHHMHKAWCTLTVAQHQWFRSWLQRIVSEAIDAALPHDGPCHSVCNATALQRAEAFLRTVDKWELTCRYPDCGCPEARLCVANNPNEAAMSLNRPHKPT